MVQLLISTIILIIIYIYVAHIDATDYYRNYNCGYVLTIFVINSNIIFIKFFGIIAVTLLIQSIFRYIFETRYNFSVVESLRVMDLNENRIS